MKLNKTKKVAIVIVTYNRLKMFKELIESLRKQDYMNFKIIVVNNSSDDGTKEYLDLQKDLIVITQENSGGAGGFFTGLKYVAENNFDYAWVMDDDVSVLNNSLTKLIEKADFLQDNFGFLCSKVVDLENLPCNVPAIDTRKNKTGDVEWNFFSENNLIKVTEASFVSFFIKKQTIIDLGLPYKHFFIWGDDTEYSLRISRKCNCYYVGDSIVLHKRYSNKILSIFTEEKQSRIKNYFFYYRNGLFVTKKYKQKGYVFYRYCRSFLDFLFLFLTLKLSKSFIIIKAIFASISFNPRLEFPCK